MGRLELSHRPEAGGRFGIGHLAERAAATLSGGDRTLDVLGVPVGGRVGYGGGH